MDGPVTEGFRGEDVDEGGDAACWAHLVCDQCGQVFEPGVTHQCPDGDVSSTASD